MSIQDFPKKRNIRIVDTDEVVRMGSFQTVKNGELTYVKVLFYIKSRIAGTERFRLKVYADSIYSSLLYTSEWTDLGDISEIANVNSSNGWHGWVAATFNRENINKESTYYLAFEIDDYTVNGTTFFISLVYDTPDPIYDNGESKFYKHPMAFIMFNYEDI